MQIKTKLPARISEMIAEDHLSDGKSVFVSFYGNAKELTIVSLVQAYQKRDDELMAMIPGLHESIQRFDETVGTHDYMRYLFYAKDTGFLVDCQGFWQEQLDTLQLLQSEDGRAFKVFRSLDDFYAWVPLHEKEAVLIATIRTDDSARLITDCDIELAGALNCDLISDGRSVPKISMTEVFVITIALSSELKSYSDLIKVTDAVCTRLFSENRERVEMMIRMTILDEMMGGNYLW